MALGDVVISMPAAKRQAAALGHSLRDELARLLVHGVLHLLGYDHERSERDALRMARKEKVVLKAISSQYSDPKKSLRGALRRSNLKAVDAEKEIASLRSQ